MYTVHILHITVPYITCKFNYMYMISFSFLMNDSDLKFVLTSVNHWYSPIAFKASLTFLLGKPISISWVTTGLTSGGGSWFLGSWFLGFFGLFRLTLLGGTSAGGLTGGNSSFSLSDSEDSESSTSSRLVAVRYWATANAAPCSWKKKN